MRDRATAAPPDLAAYLGHVLAFGNAVGIRQLVVALFDHVFELEALIFIITIIGAHGFSSVERRGLPSARASPRRPPRRRPDEVCRYEAQQRGA